MKKQLLTSLLLAALLIFQHAAQAEDIDLFLGIPPGESEPPNVLIILDNTGNWSSPFVNEKAALVDVFNALPVDKFRVGLMMFTETGSGNTGNDGAYVRGAIRPMSSANKTLYANMIDSFDDVNDRSNSGKAGKTMAEAYYYFAAQAPFAGNNKNKTDYVGNAYNPNPAALGASLAASRAVWAIADNASTGTFHALASKAGSPYISPVAEDCAKNFIIWISNGAAQDSNNDTVAARNLLADAATAAGLSAETMTATIPVAGGSQDNMADEWARFMKMSEQGVTTYTVDINKVLTGQGPGWTNLLESMATESGGRYFDVDSTTNAGQEISDALNQIFTEIQAVNSVFASVSLPASANTQNTFLNQVFVGMFRPDSNAFPRWLGNLKQYKLGLVSGVIDTLDADSNVAINSNTGFITECARSFWTPSTTNNYWDFMEAFFTSQGGCLAVADSDGSDFPDGKFVEKGAQGYKLRNPTAPATPASRVVKTCSATFSACTTLTDFNNTNVTQANLGASDTTERDELINWAQALDVDDENNNTVFTTEARPSAHGDVVHSRPVAINYGSDASPQVVVFYSGNDGVLRAINGNRDDVVDPSTRNIGTVVPGAELWAFVPPEFYPHLKRLRDNDTQISFPGNTNTSAPKPYGIDGPIVAFTGSIAGTPKTFIYASMRRGGRALYAFDVTTPASPTLKWKTGCPNAADDSGCTGAPNHTGDDFTGIGQTWSTPSVIHATGYDAGNSPMLIVGGGYDPCEDTDNGTNNHSCTSSTKGHKVYVLDADSGALLKTFDTDRSVAGGITIVNDNAGKAQYGYTTDMGGNVYRITMLADAPADWGFTKIASLGCDTIASCNANRKFMFPPDVVKDPSSATHFVLVGSGDREKPLLGYSAASAVTNYFFMLKDRPTDSNWLTGENANCSANLICLASLTPILDSSTPSDVTLDASKGWYLGLVATEQVVTSAITVSNVVTFSTHQPAVADPDSCGSNLGIANVFNIDYRNAESANSSLDGSRFEQISGGGLPPSPIAGQVILDDGSVVPFLIGGSPDSPLRGRPPGGTVSWTQPKSRVYWYIEQ